MTVNDVDVGTVIGYAGATSGTTPAGFHASDKAIGGTFKDFAAVATSTPNNITVIALICSLKNEQLAEALTGEIIAEILASLGTAHNSSFHSPSVET